MPIFPFVKQVCGVVTFWQFNTIFDQSIGKAFGEDKVQAADEPLTSVTSFNLCLRRFVCVYVW